MQAYLGLNGHIIFMAANQGTFQILFHVKHIACHFGLFVGRLTFVATMKGSSIWLLLI